jgi:fructosamine-3-kinase
LATDRAYVAGLAAAAGLGELTAEPVVLKPGSVASWRLTTARGDFHVKRFARGDWPWLRQSLAACAQIERAAQRAGVPLAEPVVLGADVGDEIVNVHRWWNGRPVEPKHDVAGWLGRTLAKLHTIPPPSEAPADALTSYYGLHPPGDWRAWFSEGRSLGLAWADSDEPLAAVLDATEVIAAGLTAESRRAGTHRDLLGANILTDGAEFALIDWDCAGPDVPWFEAIRAAVEFGRVSATVHGAKPLQPDPGVSRAILAAYTRAGGERGVDGRCGLAGVLGMMLWRLAFAVWVSLGHRPVTPDERAASVTYVSGALAKLSDRVRNLDTLVRAIGL